MEPVRAGKADFKSNVDSPEAAPGAGLIFLDSSTSCRPAADTAPEPTVPTHLEAPDHHVKK